MIYITKSGETWDEVAFNVLGDCRYTSDLINANRDKLDYYIFKAGVSLTIPEITSETIKVNLPAWF